MPGVPLPSLSPLRYCPSSHARSDCRRWLRRQWMSARCTSRSTRHVPVGRSGSSRCCRVRMAGSASVSLTSGGGRRARRLCLYPEHEMAYWMIHSPLKRRRRRSWPGQHRHVMPKRRRLRRVVPAKHRPLTPLTSPNRKGKACSCPPLTSPRCFAASHISASYSSLVLPRGCHRDGCAGSVLPGNGFVAGGTGSGAHDHLQPPSAGTPLAARRRQMPPLRRRGTSAL